jgi:hypothetical protein
LSFNFPNNILINKCSAVNGGGIYVVQHNIDLILTINSSFMITECTCSEKGGILYTEIPAEKKVVFTSDSSDHNSISLIDGKLGGALYIVSSGKVIISNIIFSSYTSSDDSDCFFFSFFFV